MQRYLEAAWRLKGRVLLGAALVFGVVSGALILAKQGYGAAATVWVDEPVYFTDANLTRGWNPYLSPADNQVGILQELLRTRQFTLSVAKGAQIPMANEVVENRYINEIQKGMRVESQGQHLIKISYSAPQGTYCKAVIEQVIKLFTDEVNTNRATQATVALGLYQKQKDTYAAAMQKSHDALAKYIQANPESVSAGAAPNPALADLQQQYAADRARYDDVMAKIDRVTLDSTAAGQLSAQFFRVIDAPSDPAANTLTSKVLLTNSGLALGLALVVALGIIVLGAWVDQGVYAAQEIVGLAPLGMDGTTPELLVAAVPFVKGLGAQRRAAEQAARAARKAQGKAGAETPGGHTGPPLQPAGVLTPRALASRVGQPEPRQQPIERRPAVAQVAESVVAPALVVAAQVAESPLAPAPVVVVELVEESPLAPAPVAVTRIEGRPLAPEPVVDALAEDMLAGIEPFTVEESPVAPEPLAEAAFVEDMLAGIKPFTVAAFVDDAPAAPELFRVGAFVEDRPARAAEGAEDRQRGDQGPRRSTGVLS